MLIIAGSLQVSPAERDAYVARCAPIVEAARSTEGCLDFSISADIVERDRVVVYERWDTEEELIAFRAAGPSDDQQAKILEADIKRYIISSVGEP